MPPRRHRRLSLAHAAPAAAPVPRSRAKSWSARASQRLLRPPPPPPTSPTAFVPVRVRDFVTVPPARHAPPSLALGPLDAAARPPSYDLKLATRRLSRAVAATQTAPDWDPSLVDSFLDWDDARHDGTSPPDHHAQDSEPTATAAPPQVAHDRSLAPPVFVIEDASHIAGLRDIVSRGDAVSESAASGGRRRALVSSIDARRASTSSTASSSSSSATTELSTTSSCDPTVATPSSSTRGGSQRTHSAGSSSTGSDSPRSHPRGGRSRRTLINSTGLSPVKYTFRPPVPARLKEVPSPAVTERCRDRHETGVPVVGVGVGPAVWPYRTRIQAAGAGASDRGVPAGPVTPPDMVAAFGGMEGLSRMPNIPMSPPLLAMSIFRKGKRESNESARSSAASTSTEYYEDEYTKFIEKKAAGSPLRIPGKPYLAKMMNNESWVGKSNPMECNRSNSTVSVATSDDEYDPSHERLTNMKG